MQLNVGAIVEGKVTGITKFGAFIEIEKGVNGLVHISEISDSYVTDVADFLEKGDEVKAKVLSADNGKISLSLKAVGPVHPKNDSNQSKSGNDSTGFRIDKDAVKSNEPPKVYKPFKKEEPLSFEEMLSRFKKSSEEKISDIKRNIDNKRGSYSKKR